MLKTKQLKKSNEKYQKYQIIFGQVKKYRRNIDLFGINTCYFYFILFYLFSFIFFLCLDFH